MDLGIEDAFVLVRTGALFAVAAAAAVHLLRTGHASVDQTAAGVGYANGVTLRALPRRRLGRGVGEIRRSL